MKKDQIIIGKLVDNMIIRIINHNMGYRTAFNGIVMIE